MKQLLKRFSLVCCSIISFMAHTAMASDSISVNSHTNAVDGNVHSFLSLKQTPGFDNEISLHEAILAAHGKDQPVGSKVINIEFENGQFLPVLHPLPAISTDNLSIYGNGAILDGISCVDCNGIVVTGSANVIHGLTIINFEQHGFVISGLDAIGNEISEVSLGLLDESPNPNRWPALVISDGASYNTVLDTVVSGNRSNGVIIKGFDTRGNKILSSFIGVTRDGKKAVTNGFEFVDGWSESYGIVINNAPETVIGDGADSGNLISTFHSYALAISGKFASNITIQGNTFDIQPEIVASLPDVSPGIAIDVASGASNVLIGGENPENGNHINAHPEGTAIYIGPFSTSPTTVSAIRIANNIISRSPNPKFSALSGVIIDDRTSDAVIGPGNTISGFKRGILIRDMAGQIQITRNSIFNNELGGIVFETEGIFFAAADISNTSPYFGTTDPCIRVDFFADEANQGRIYLGTEYSAPDGTFTLRAPVDIPDNMNITTIVTDRFGNSSAFSEPVPVTGVERGPLSENPEPGICAGFYVASADYDGDFAVNISELLRVIQLYNSLAYACDALTEDGYAPGSGDQTCTPHSGDYRPQDWRFSLSELLRVVQFYNSNGYERCLDGEDGFCPLPV